MVTVGMSLTSVAGCVTVCVIICHLCHCVSHVYMLCRLSLNVFSMPHNFTYVHVSLNVTICHICVLQAVWTCMS